VERDAGAARTIGLNLRQTRLSAGGTVHQADALAFLERVSGPWDLVLVDPPYDDPVMLAVLERLGSGAALAPGATVVAKHFWRDRQPQRTGALTRVSERRFGETALTYYRADRGGEP
jgi:16S rRNA G966 N2-methylase RsmD